MSRSDAVLQYRAALKHGIKYYQSSISQGKNPYPPVLDDIVNETQISGQQVIGTVEVPLSLVAGTLAAGRKSAFAADFSPLLSEESEFAQKWISLCHAQLDEGGIRDAIKCIEFMGRFYVIEGNKRVSVLKSFGAATIMADVTRSVPVWSDTPEIKAYYEFMRFNKITGMYLIRTAALTATKSCCCSLWRSVLRTRSTSGSRAACRKCRPATSCWNASRCIPLTS